MGLSQWLLRIQRSGKTKNSLFLLAEKLLLLSLGFLLTLLLARMWPAQRLGEYQYLLAMVALLGPFSALGLNSLVSRELVLSQEDTGKVLGTALLLRIAGALFAGMLMFVASFWWVEATLRPIFWLLLCSQVFHAFGVFDFYFESKVRSWVSATLRSANGAFFLTVKLMWLWGNGSLEGMLLITAIEWLLLGVLWHRVFRLAEPNRYSLSVSWQQAIYLLRRCGWLLLSGVAAVIYLKVDTVMLGWLDDKSEVARYSLASRLSEVWYIFPGILVASWFPSLLTLKGQNHEHYRKRLQSLCDFLAWIAIIIALLITMVSAPLMAWLFGEQYRDAGNILQIHIWASVFIFMRALLSKWILIEDIPKYSLLTHGAGALLNIGLNAMWIPHFGGEGAAMATLISYAAASYFSLFLFHKTRPFALVMTKSLLLPVRLLFLRSTRLGND
ncbi:flippase [Shewanella sp. FJAT-52076]|uniref:flippase n=1 Tax=Shewanella sp. FJAT-52076 TaxID=2864202 RepID=UPI001C65EE54|nr:flippase [Shewanella sp. FJAT-52076]QYJ74047.1 flippase [Shewanella sp. FJAT-52076]